MAQLGVLSGARRLGMADRVDCFSWVCSQMLPEYHTFVFGFSSHSNQVLGVCMSACHSGQACFFSVACRSGVPPGPAIPVLSTHLLEATALSGNYYLGDKCGDKPVLVCMMYEVSTQRKRCT